jgi:hypothetical protein
MCLTCVACRAQDVRRDPALASRAATCHRTIEAHKQAEATFTAVLRAQSAFEDIHRGPGGKLPAAADYSELRDFEEKEDRLGEAVTNAVGVLADVAPTTLDGAVALLRYLAETNAEAGLFFQDLEDGKNKPLSYFIHRNLADALEDMALRL